MFSIVHKAAQLAPTAAPDELECVVSDETVDRYGDIIRAEGWQLADYQRNPIVLFAHDSAWPVGVAPRVWREGPKLMARIKLAAQGTSELIDALRSLVAQKIIRAVSVGFRPTKEPQLLRDAEQRPTGYEFIGQELLEISLVAVGANPHALAVAKSMNLSDATLRQAFAAVLTDGGSDVRLARAGLDIRRLRVRSRKSGER